MQTSSPLLPGMRAGLTAREIDGEVIVFDPSADATHRLNASAVDIWRLCGESGRIDDVVAELEYLYDVDAATAAADVRRLVRTLAELGLTLQPLLVA